MATAATSSQQAETPPLPGTLSAPHYYWGDNELESKDDPPEPDPDSLASGASGPPPTTAHDPPPSPASFCLRQDRVSGMPGVPSEPDPGLPVLEASGPPPTTAQAPPPSPASSRFRDETEEAALRTPGSENGNQDGVPGEPDSADLPPAAPPGEEIPSPGTATSPVAPANSQSPIANCGFHPTADHQELKADSARYNFRTHRGPQQARFWLAGVEASVFSRDGPY
jgi:hypothetical protein